MERLLSDQGTKPVKGFMWAPCPFQWVGSGKEPEGTIKAVGGGDCSRFLKQKYDPLCSLHIFHPIEVG